MINTNVDGLKDSAGRRIMIMPVSNIHVDDFEYFSNIRKQCFILKVGEAFYSYMMELNIDGFYAQRDTQGTLNTTTTNNTLVNTCIVICSKCFIIRKINNWICESLE